MPDQMLIAYVRQEIERGTPLYQISRTLFKNKWTLEEIEAAVSAVTGQLVSVHDHIQPAPFPSILELYAQAFQIIRARIWRLAAVIGIATLAVFGIQSFVNLLFANSVGVLRSIIIVALLRICVLCAVCALVMVVVSKTRMPIGKIFGRFFVICIPFVCTAIMFRLVVSAGFILLVVPGLLMWCLYSLWPFILIDERVYGSRALVRSFAFVSEHRNAYVTRFLAGEFLLGIVTLALSGIQSGVHNSIFTVVVIVIDLVLNAIIIAYQYVLYQEVKERYAGNVIPTPRHRMFIICTALFPLFLLSVWIILFVSLLVEAIKNFT